MIIWGILLLAAVVSTLAWLYFRMSPLQRAAYWMNVRASLPGGAGRCRECGDLAESRAYPYCSEEHADRYEASTAW